MDGMATVDFLGTHSGLSGVGTVKEQGAGSKSRGVSLRYLGNDQPASGDQAWRKR